MTAGVDATRPATNVIEFVQAKAAAPYRCEDVTCTTGGLYAVIDGATDHSGIRFDLDGNTVTGGLFVARTISDTLAELGAGHAPRVAVTAISTAVDDAIGAQHGDLPGDRRPCASVIVYDPELALVWRVGDCQARIGDTVHNDGKLIDDIATDFRLAVLATWPERGRHSGGNPGLDAILPLVTRQGLLANTDGPYGYGVINGTHVPDDHIDTFDVPAGATVVLASDGYPDITGSLDDAEMHLHTALAADPDCVSELRGTKGLRPGGRSFDDRAWLEVRTDA